MAGGLQWRNALARALKSEEVTRRSPLPVQLQRRAFSAQAPPARSTSFLQAHIQSPSQTRCSQQWRQQSLPAQSFAPNRRKFSTTPIARHNHLDPPKPGEERRVTFVTKEGESYTFLVADGDNLLDIAQDNDLEMEGACGGSCACSTCHVIVQDEGMYSKMDEPDDDENDMLDLAFGLTETSRLGCQVKMSKELDGLVVKLPSMTRNLQASDFGDK
ncbi:hypothetical protein GRF29_213g1142678 [Pseudopithomyces chartarum]|uniref:2Fe-2S ferredoxin-type domain-containing protein n=1 Tax=Pseudopithomyces chartarum TaxID=1892770 RepID=A0AAN6LS90_9PLEO|nr:hypothetical protein GRF29_213g1142678 [Pseudopithomyces chartarum]